MTLEELLSLFPSDINLLTKNTVFALTLIKSGWVFRNDDLFRLEFIKDSKIIGWITYESLCEDPILHFSMFCELRIGTNPWDILDLAKQLKQKEIF